MASTRPMEISRVSSTNSLASLMPAPPEFCSSCNELAQMAYECSACHKVNHYCTKYVCQTDHWNKHLDDCDVLIESREQGQTVITRLRDGCKWTRSRRRASVADDNLGVHMARVPVLDIHAQQIVQPVMEGWLAHAGDNNKEWVLRYFVLRDDVLFCFSNEDSLARGGISLMGFKVRGAEEEVKEKAAIKLYHVLDGRAHYLVASDKDDAAKWIKAISRSGMLRQGTTLLRPGLGDGHGGSSMTLSAVDIPSVDNKGGDEEDLVRSMPLRNRIGDASTSTRRIYLTPFLSEPTSDTAASDISTRQQSMKRVMGTAPPYNRDNVRAQASELGGEVAEAFAKSRGFSLFRRGIRPASSMPSLARTSSSSSLASNNGPPDGRASPEERSGSGLRPRPISSGGVDIPSSRTSLHASRSLDSSPSSLPDSRESPTFGSSPNFSAAAMNRSSRSQSSTGGDWNSATLQRRRSVAPMADAAAVAAASAMFVQLQSGSHHTREGSDASSDAGAGFEQPAFYINGYLTRMDVTPEVRLWCEIDDFYFSAYASDVSSAKLLEIDLEGCDYVPEGADVFRLQQGNNILRMRAVDSTERDRWVRLMDGMRDYFSMESQRQRAKSPISRRISSNSLISNLSNDEPDGEFTLTTNNLARSKRSAESEKELAKKQSDEEFTRALEQATADLKAKTLGSYSPAMAALDTTLGPGSPRTPLGPMPVYTKPLSTPDEIKAAQLEALKRRMSYLFPHKSTTEKDVRPPTNGKVLNKEEAKKFALHDTLSSESEEGISHNTVIMAQDDEDIVFQYHVGTSGLIDEYNIMAASPERLIARLADERHPDSSFIDIFLLTYRHIMSPSQLMDRLFARFNVQPPPCPTAEDLAYYNQWASIIRVRTVGVVKKWIDNYWIDFAGDGAALRTLTEFFAFSEKLSPEMGTLIERLRRIVVDRQEAARAAELVNSAKEPPKALKIDFIRFEPRDFARQLAIADQALFAAIAPVEFVLRLWEGISDQSQHITELIDWFNRMSFFTATTIVSQPSAKKRAMLIENFIKVLKESYRINNFNGMMAILSGLNNASVRRLKKSWALVPARHSETLKQMEELMASAFNYRVYRAALATAEKSGSPVVPFIGLFLRDLTFLNDGNPKKFKNLMNMGKLRMIAQRILKLQVLQMGRYAFPTSGASSTIKEFLKAPYAMHDENMLFALSLQCEPRENK